mgnify:CR=1 FL=1
MAWQERTVENMREEFVRRVLAKEQSKAALCREYGISRPTGDKWLQRFRDEESLSDRSRAPLTQARRVPQETEALIVGMRQKYPALGAVKIRKIMENEGYQSLPSARTFNNIFHRHDLITKEASQAASHHKRFEKSQPNDMWQADFKGHFQMQNGQRCHPLNVLDDCSRYCLCSEALTSETFNAVKPVFERLFTEYGLPFSLLCDNGNPWGTPQSMGYTAFEVWLMELGILTIHGRPLHPQTQGKEERYNRSFTRECLNGNTFLDIPDSQSKFDEYRRFYNNTRPHCALELNVPASVFQNSARQFPGKVQEWEYGPEYQQCKVSATGYFCYGGHRYFLSEGFRDKKIGVRESSLPGQITLVFRQFRIGRIDLDKRVYTLKKCYLLDNDPRLA